MKSRTLILVIALIGLIVSGYAITLHYATGPSKLCDISATISCDKVNKSTYSVFLGIPVAVLGFLSYLLVFFAMLFRKRIERWTAFTSKDFAQYFFFFVIVMLLFQLYLTSIEIFVLKAYCIVCLISQACTLVLAYLAWKEFR